MITLPLQTAYMFNMIKIIQILRIKNQFGLLELVVTLNKVLVLVGEGKNPTLKNLELIK